MLAFALEKGTAEERADNRDNVDLVDVVTISLDLVKLEKLPAVGDKRAFNTRCREIIKVVNPKAETDVKKLTALQKLRMAAAWGIEVCQRCANPAAKRFAAFDSHTLSLTHI